MLRAPLTRLENYSWFSVPLEPNKGPHSHRPSSQTAIVIITLVLNKGLFCNEEKIMLVVDCQHQMSNVNIKCPMSISNVLSLLLTKHRNEQADLKMTCQLQEKLFKHHAIGQPEWTLSQSVMLYAVQEASVGNMLHWPRALLRLNERFSQRPNKQ